MTGTAMFEEIRSIQSRPFPHRLQLALPISILQLALPTFISFAFLALNLLFARNQASQREQQQRELLSFAWWSLDICLPTVISHILTATGAAPDISTVCPIDALCCSSYFPLQPPPPRNPLPPPPHRNHTAVICYSQPSPLTRPGQATTSSHYLSISQPFS